MATGLFEISVRARINEMKQAADKVSSSLCLLTNRDSVYAREQRALRDALLEAESVFQEALLRWQEERDERAGGIR